MGLCYKLFSISDSQALGWLDNPEQIHDFIAKNYTTEDPIKAIWLEKSWHVLHFVMTQSAWEGEPPLNFLLSGDTIGEVDIGYGPARILLSRSVLEISQALTQFSEEDFDRNFDPAAMVKAEIYPDHIWDQPRPDLLAAYLEDFDDLKKFMSLTGKAKQAVLITVR